MSKKQPKFEIDFHQRLEDQKKSKGITQPKLQRHAYTVIPPEDELCYDDYDTFAKIMELHFIKIFPPIEKLTRDEVIEKKLMGYTVKPVKEKNGKKRMVRH